MSPLPPGSWKRPASMTSEPHAAADETTVAAAGHGGDAEPPFSSHLESIGKLAASTVLTNDGLMPALQEIAEVSAQVLDVDRVAIYQFDKAEQTAYCTNIYTRQTNTHGPGDNVNLGAHADYIDSQKHQHIFSVADVANDGRVDDIRHLLQPIGIGAFMDVTVRREGRFAGSIVFSQFGDAHLWTKEEQALGGVFAEFVSRTWETHDRRRMESIFKDFADAASDWFWETDAAGRFTYLSDRFYDVSGTEPISIIGKTNAELGRYIEKPEDIERVAQALAAHEPYKNVIASRVLPDGRRLWVRTGGVPVFDERGQFSGYRGASTDISESMQAEADLREQANLLQTILDNVPAIVAFRDQDARFVFANKKGAAVHALFTSGGPDTSVVEVLCNSAIPQTIILERLH